MDYKTLSEFINSAKPDESLMLIRFPGEQKINAYIGFASETRDENSEGLVFAAFDRNKKSYLLTPTKSQIFEISPSNSTQKIKVDIQKNFDAYATRFQEFSSAIKSGAFRKLVLSRKLVVSETIDILASFLSACNAYPNACCYLWYTSKTGYWLGASPEVLVEQHNQQLATYALAATKSAEDKSPWSEKEKEEQAIVTQYILDSLKSLGLNPVASSTVEAKAGKLKHLKTTITAALTADTSALRVAEQLHPTPAVAGFPKEKAIDFIMNHEGYDRSFYTGYFGLLQKNTTRLFVNLRCLQLYQNKTSIYVGGGLTKDSELIAEWQETQKKATTMLDILRSKAD